MVCILPGALEGYTILYYSKFVVSRLLWDYDSKSILNKPGGACPQTPIHDDADDSMKW